MTRATSLAEMIGNDAFAAALERAAAAFDRYRERLPLIPFAYSRTRLERTDAYEIIVMRWAPGSVSPLHDHGTSRCWVQMIDGALEVENFYREEPLDGTHATLQVGRRVTVRTGDLDSRCGPHELHRVRNQTEESAYSLQLYAGPIGAYHVFDDVTGQARDVVAGIDLSLDLTTI